MRTDFFKWYTENAKKHDGLTSPANAAKMIGISTQHLNRIIEMGRINKYYFKKTPFIGLDEIYEEIQRRGAKEYTREFSEAVLAPIYPSPELNDWIEELQQKFSNVMGGATEEQRRDFFDQRLQEWKKTADPERVKLLAERTKKIALQEWKSI
ncbi:MAG: hypothetical protein PHV82_12135 [Victivallaceae bacterium]|nr:hypothetical protein [Victivallaceae bacterium]